MNLLRAITARKSGIAYDSDAQAFFNAAVITDATQKSAVDTLVKDLKGYGIWTNIKAIYPFVGGTAAAHKYNLKNPADTDAAFRLTFTGSWTHSGNGSQPSASNSYADTKLNISSHLNLNSTHIGVYVRQPFDNRGAIINESGYDNGLYLWSMQSFRMHDYSSDNSIFDGVDAKAGFHLGSRTGANIKRRFLDGVRRGNHTTASSALLNQKLYLMGSPSGNTQTSQVELCLATIGLGLTDSEATNFYTAVQAFQTTLGRQV